MTNDRAIAGSVRTNRWRVAGWGMAAVLLLLPFVAMQLGSEEVNWTAADFAFAAVLLGSVGISLELVAAKSPNRPYLAGAGLMILAAFVTVWINAAVGMIGSEHNSYNLLFGGVLLIALGGAILGRFAPTAMMRAAIAAGVAQAAIGAIGLASDPLGGSFSIALAAPWLLAAALFRWAARRGAA
jgi:hypothetical protein